MSGSTKLSQDQEEVYKLLSPDGKLPVNVFLASINNSSTMELPKTPIQKMTQKIKALPQDLKKQFTTNLPTIPLQTILLPNNTLDDDIRSLRLQLTEFYRKEITVFFNSCTTIEQFQATITCFYEKVNKIRDQSRPTPKVIPKTFYKWFHKHTKIDPMTLPLIRAINTKIQNRLLLSKNQSIQQMQKIQQMIQNSITQEEVTAMIHSLYETQKLSSRNFTSVHPEYRDRNLLFRDLYQCLKR